MFDKVTKLFTIWLPFHLQFRINTFIFQNKVSICTLAVRMIAWWTKKCLKLNIHGKSACLCQSLLANVRYHIKVHLFINFKIILIYEYWYGLYIFTFLLHNVWFISNSITCTVMHGTHVLIKCDQLCMCDIYVCW